MVFGSFPRNRGSLTFSGVVYVTSQQIERRHNLLGVVIRGKLWVSSVRFKLWAIAFSHG